MNCFRDGNVSGSVGPPLWLRQKWMDWMNLHECLRSEMSSNPGDSPQGLSVSFCGPGFDTNVTH